MKQLGTLIITGTKNIEYDGLQLGQSKVTMRFQVTDKGFIRNSKLFKTHDQELLAEKLGFIDFKTHLKYNLKG